MSAIPPPPAGFGPSPDYGEFHDLAGPFYEMVHDEHRLTVGIYVQDKHLNGRNMHGGMYLMLADTAMTCAAARLAAQYGNCVTATLSSEFIGPAKAGEWIEAEVEVLKAGRRAIFVSAIVHRGRGGTEPLLRASATFIVKHRKT